MTTPQTCWAGWNLGTYPICARQFKRTIRITEQQTQVLKGTSKKKNKRQPNKKKKPMRLEQDSGLCSLRTNFVRMCCLWGPGWSSHCPIPRVRQSRFLMNVLSQCCYCLNYNLDKTTPMGILHVITMANRSSQTGCLLVPRQAPPKLPSWEACFRNSSLTS